MSFKLYSKSANVVIYVNSEVVRYDS